MSDTQAKPISNVKGEDKETLVSIVKEMTESVTGSPKHSALGRGYLMVRHPAVCLAGYSACIEVL